MAKGEENMDIDIGAYREKKCSVAYIFRAF